MRLLPLLLSLYRTFLVNKSSMLQIKIEVGMRRPQLVIFYAHSGTEAQASMHHFQNTPLQPIWDVMEFSISNQLVFSQRKQGMVHNPYPAKRFINQPTNCRQVKMCDRYQKIAAMAISHPTLT